MAKQNTTLKDMSFSVRLLANDPNEMDHVWRMVVRNMCNAMLPGTTLNGARHPLVITGTLFAFILFYQLLGNIAMSGAIAIVALLCATIANAYYGLYCGLYSYRICPDAGRNMYKFYNDDNRGRRCWVVTYDEKIVAVAGVQEKPTAEGDTRERSPSVAVLQRVVVEPEFRRMGVAVALVDIAVEFCKEQNYREIILYTSEFQYNAMRFYLKCGFEEFGQFTFDDFFPLFRLKMHLFKLVLEGDL